MSGRTKLKARVERGFWVVAKLKAFCIVGRESVVHPDVTCGRVNHVAHHVIEPGHIGRKRLGRRRGERRRRERRMRLVTVSTVI